MWSYPTGSGLPGAAVGTVRRDGQAAVVASEGEWARDGRHIAARFAQRRSSSTDDDFVFFNNPTVPGVTVREHTADIDLGQIPVDIARIVIAAVQDDADPRRCQRGSCTSPSTWRWLFPSPG